MTPLAPPPRDARRLLLDGPQATEALARRLAPALRAGDVLLLEGPIGAGKTHFARALIQTLQRATGQRPEEVPSPSYTLVQEYAAGPLAIWHADLYRLGDASEVPELGLEAAFGRALVLVEWPERLGTPPPQSLTLRIAPPPDGTGLDDARLLTLHPAGPRGAALAEVALG
ncbi:MAG: tRNA (adenosine(37)-N6)-threonylcarbamoyltransferase complex ATPase subunit type 1 TsaE [Alkalilacustris sp.]